MDVIRKTLGTLLFRLASLVTGMLTGVVTARLLGPAGKGVYAYATLVASIYLTFFGGLSAAAAREVSNLKEQPEATLANGAALATIFGLGTVAATLVISIFTRYEATLLLVVIIAPICLWQSVMQGTFLGLGRVFEVNAGSLVQNLALLTGFVLLVVFGQRTPTWAVGAWSGAQVIAATWLYARTLQHWRLNVNLIDRESLSRLARFVIQIGAINVVSFLNYRIDSFLVERYLGLTQLGIYSVAISLSELVWQFSSALSQVIYAKVGSASRMESARLIGRTLRHMIIVVVLSALALAVLGGWVIRFLYGQAFSDALPVMWVLLPGAKMYSMASIVSVFYTNQLGRPGISFALACLSMCICLVSSVILIPRFGILGGAIATSLSYIISASASFVITSRLTGLGLLDMFVLNREDLRDIHHVLASFLNRVLRRAA